MLRRAVRSWTFAGIHGGRDMECAYYFDFCRLCRVCLRQFLFLWLFRLLTSDLCPVIAWICRG
jgi:hypothetical protein